MILAADTQEPAPLWLYFAIPVAFAIVFPTIWCFVCFLISWTGGWHTLSKKYAAGARKPIGPEHSGVVGQIGVASYKFTLTVNIAPDGFFLKVMPFFRPGHPPLFIPWGEITDRGSIQFLRREMVRLRIGNPKAASVALALPAKLFDRPT